MREPSARSRLVRAKVMIVGLLMFVVHDTLHSEKDASFQRPRESADIRAGAPSSGARIPYYEAYRAGVRLYELKRYGEAAINFANARAGEPQNQSHFRLVRLYGMRYEEYFPAFYEARARIRDHDCDKSTIDVLLARAGEEVG